jgi:hypothetical protein
MEHSVGPPDRRWYSERVRTLREYRASGGKNSPCHLSHRQRQNKRTVGDDDEYRINLTAAFL